VIDMTEYSKTNWLEYGMSTVARVAALNNLETIYSTAITYIDSITHSNIYYNKTEVGTTYFTSATDGSGTSLICSTLDGYTALQIIAAGVPPGTIAIWSGTEASIPDGYYLCNGYNSTPNLLSRFVVGAGGNYVVGATGGNGLVTTSGSVVVGGHSLTEGETPLHTHGVITDYYASSTLTREPPSTFFNRTAVGTSLTDLDSYTDYRGDGDSHTHTASFAGTSNEDKRPPFYALCYIQKG
jgi:hypothetical protein